MAASTLSLTVLFLFLVPATAGGNGDYSGAARMVIIRGPATRVVDAGGAQSNKWRQHYHYHRRLVEDEVAPEELGGVLLGAADGHIDYGALDPNNPACKGGGGSSSQCAAKDPGEPYTRPCKYKDHCSQGQAGRAAGVATNNIG